jgi:ATP-dependent Clp protease adaptor protein ClpS
MSKTATARPDQERLDADHGTAEVHGTQQVRAEQKKPPKRQPRFHVILWDDNDHTYEYVIRMMQELFGHSSTRGYMLAREVDKTGRTICLTTTLEHAELKRDQIHAYGKDHHIPRCAGSMTCTLEAAE